MIIARSLMRVVLPEEELLQGALWLREEEREGGEVVRGREGLAQRVQGQDTVGEAT